jgi:L-lactate dehydrogenase complex protein LldG
MQSREKILGKISKALQNSTPRPFENLPPIHISSLYRPGSGDLSIDFAEAFVQLQGRFAYCLHLAELSQQLQALLTLRQWSRIYCADAELRKLLPDQVWYHHLADCHAAITGCDALVARTGSIVLSAAQALGRTASVYAPVHLCIAHTRQLVPDVEDALQLLDKKYGPAYPSFVTFAGGPSRTADIEKTLVTGVHGPAEVYCFLVE